MIDQIRCFSLLLFGLLVCAPSISQAALPNTPPDPPRLVVVITIDGLPQHQILQNRDLLGKGGFRLLLERGAWYTDAHYAHAATFTACGHATLLTGAHPYRHGLVGNDWTDRKTGERVYCVEDPDSPVLGTSVADNWSISPANLRVTTVGDELRLATAGRAKVISISLKDRGAVLPGGKLGTAYFYNRRSGQFVTSRYYLNEYPEWWQQFHKNRPQDRFFGESWEPLREAEAYLRSAPTGRELHKDVAGLGKSFPHPLGGGEEHPGPDYYSALPLTPYGHAYTLDFVVAATKGERLGKNGEGASDLLAVSFSSHDYVNHGFGPESAESQDAFLRLDRILAELFDFLDEWVGIDDVLLVLTADHGFANTPEYLSEKGVEAGRIDPDQMLKELNQDLQASYGSGTYAYSWFNPTIFLDYSVIDKKELPAEEVEAAAAGFLATYPGVAAVYTRTQLQEGHLPDTYLAKLVQRSWHPRISGDLFVVQKPGWYLLGAPSANAATHGSPHSYDTHVPVMFLGPWVHPGRHDQRITVNDIAPTLALLLGVRPPSASEGQVLGEMLVH